LSERRLILLTSINFAFDPYPDEWSNNLKALQGYHAEFKSWNVPKEWNKALCAWLSAQRTAFKFDKLSQKRIDGLNEISFDWRTLNEQKWDATFEVLVAFKNKYGDFDVSYKFAEAPKLRTWIDEQRRMHRDGKLTDDRRQRLGKIGFKFDVD